MEDLLSLLRLLVTTAVAVGILYGLYRGLRWRFPRLARSRAILIVALGAIALASVAFSLIRTGGVECVQHENTVILRGERVLNFSQQASQTARPVSEEAYARVLQSCAYLAAHCPIDAGDATRGAAEDICRKAATGAPLN